MINALISAILIIALFQTNSDRRFPALVFALFVWLHCVSMSGLEGFWYFFTAGLCDIVIIAIIACWARVSALADSLITISIISIVFNCYGWLLWVSYLPVSSYNYSITALYLIAILSLLRGDCANDKPRNLQRYYGLRVFSHKCRDFCLSLPKKART
jgi:hypothetical protein